MSGKRFDSVDFWRGLALIVIFVNHMPGNVLEIATPRNFGFSDSAEAFVFMAGFAGALAYGGKLERGELAKALIGIVRRVALIYIIQVFLTFLAMALYGSAYMWGGASTILAIHDRDTFLSQPLQSLVGVFLICTQIGYYNILPMYILFLAACPLLLWLANRSVLILMALSVAVYLYARIGDHNLPTFPQGGGWFFNPLCWQLIYCLGLACGTLARKGVTLPFSRAACWLAIATVASSAVVVTNALGLMPDLYADLARGLDLTKTNLGLTRLASFIAIAYVLYVGNVARHLRPTPFWRPVVLMGRNSLWVFAAGSILATIGQIIMTILPRNITIDIGYAIFGIVLLYFVAFLAQGMRREAVGEAAVPLVQPALR